MTVEQKEAKKNYLNDKQQQNTYNNHMTKENNTRYDRNRKGI